MINFCFSAYILYLFWGVGRQDGVTVGSHPAHTNNEMIDSMIYFYKQIDRGNSMSF